MLQIIPDSLITLHILMTIIGIYRLLIGTPHLHYTCIRYERTTGIS